MRYAILGLLLCAGLAPASHFKTGFVGHAAFVQQYASPVVVQRVEIPTCQVAPVAVSGYAFGHVSAFSAVAVVRQRAVRRAVIVQPVRRRVLFRHR